VTVLQRFRVLTFQITVGVSVAVAAVLYFFSVPAAKGLLAAGIVGGLVFWLNARQAEKLAFMPRAKVNSAIYRATLIRMGLYALTFYWSFTLDRDNMHGLLGALGGMFVIQIVLIFMGLTGFDLGKTTRANGTDR
jgi:hypothetical protein